ncbi:MAG: sugar phosphate isomerase/epimerase, partial [Verrucomicrobiales bacterium]|nr:sugar phosphate isomerase/epimerase [Verrucomicrobiales bacterium]
AVRPGGHVEPERVEDDLPKMVESLKKQNLKLTVMTSGINEVSDAQRTEAVLKTAAGLGVERFRMSYYKYDLKKPIRPQLDEVRPKLKELVTLCKEVGIKPVYQNHSGRNYVGGPIWDLENLFSDYDPADVGNAFDVGHATVEGAKAWPLNFALIRPYIDTVYIKDPGWVDNKLKWGALGDGSLDRGFFNTLKASQFTGPISLHVEYLGHKDPKIVPTVIKAIGENFATLKKFLAEA